MNVNSTDKFKTMIGFAKRAGKIVFGYDALVGAKGVRLVAVSDTASDNLKCGMERLAQSKGYTLVYASSLETIVGNNVKALGMTDENMAKAVIEYVSQGVPQYTIKDLTRR